jgi:UDP-glucose 4-epimerase
VVAACERVAGRPVALEVAPRRPGDAPALVADAAKLRTRLGWKPKYADLDAVIETAWRWHRRYPDGYSSKGGGAAGTAPRGA